MNVAREILSHGEDTAGAVLYRDTVLTYGELRQSVARVAAGLRARGAAKGGRVAVVSENNPFFVKVYLGIICAALIAVPLPAETPGEDFEKILTETGIEEVFASKRFVGKFRPLALRAGVRFTPEGETERETEGGGRSVGASGANSLRPGGAGESAEVEPAKDLAALMFTSGSTGTPKGVMVTHRNIECNSRDIIDYLGLTSADRAMVVLPFHYCFGLSLLHTLLMAGGSIVLNNDFRLFPEAVLQEMLLKECTGLAGVPSTYQILLRKSRFRRMSFPRLRWFQQAGGKLPNSCIAEVLESFPQARYFLMYGQTEATARLSYLPPERLTDKLGSIGNGLPSTKLEVLKPDGSPVIPGSDEIGEIVAAGDNIALGYWNDPVETAKFFRNGKLHTGDIARVDADGFIFIVEREREMIKSGGNRVSAKEIEEVIAEIPEVVEVAVLGAPHELLGEAIKAFLVPSPAAAITAQDVERHCRKRLPAFKTPEEFIFLKNMPHNGSGKVMKTKLKEMLMVRKLST